MLVRKTTLEDSQRIAQLYRDLALYHVSYHPTYRVKEHASELALAAVRDKIEKSLSGEELLLVAQNGGVVGFLSCGINERKDPNYEIRKIGHIGGVYVVPEYRNQGAATALLKEAMRWLKERKVEYADLNVDVRNAAAITAWTAMGFKPHQYNLIQKL